MRITIQIFSLILFLLFSFNGIANERVIKEDDVRKRKNDVTLYKGKYAEFYLIFKEFKDITIVFRDVYGENLRVIIPIPDELNLPYRDYIKKSKKMIWGNELEKYGKDNPDVKIREIIQKLASRSRNMPMTVIMKLKISRIKRSLNPQSQFLDTITIWGTPVYIVI